MNIEKVAYIKQIGKNKFRVYSEKGRNMGTYNSRAAAKKRLRDIEYFKHKNSAEDNYVFPRGGEGGVPEFFRKNLDYGERDRVLKNKISKLRTAKSALEKLNLKKEASGIKNNIKTVLLNAFLALGLVGSGVYLENSWSEDKSLMSFIADFAVEQSPNLEEKKMEFPLGTKTDDIIARLYPNIVVENKKDIILDFLKEYNPNLNFGESGLALKQEELFKLTERAEVAYPDLKKIVEKFSKILASGYNPSESGVVSRMSPSSEAVQFLMKTEGYSKNIYDDQRTYSWPKDKDEPKAKGHWTIGYGHLLTEKELDSGIISIPGKNINWKNGISEEDALKIKNNDLVINSVLNSGIDPNTELTKGIYDAMVDLSFNVGSGGLSDIISNSRNELGNIDEDLFVNEIGKWTKVKNKNQEKGVWLRRISQILVAKGVFLPSNPSDSKDFLTKKNVTMSYSDKGKVEEYFNHYFYSINPDKKEEKVPKEKVKKVLKDLSQNPPASFEDFVSSLEKNLL